MKAMRTWWFPFIFLTLFTFFLQTKIILCSDAINAINTAKLLLSSGPQHYGKDFLECSPPVIMYLYMIPIWISKYVGLNIVESVKFFAVLLSFFSICTCYYLVNKIDVHYPSFRYLILYCIVGMLYFVFASQLGQRENIVIILSLPYYFLVTLRIENKSIPSTFAVMIGIAAGIGFALKPYFLLVPFLIELYLIFAKRNLLIWLRIETLTILVLLIAYGIFLCLYFKFYLFDFLPLVSYFYPSSIAESWREIFHDGAVQFCCLTIIFYIVMQFFYQLPAIFRVMFIALLGFTGAFLVTRTSWYYHVLPASSLALLLFVMLGYEILMNGIHPAGAFLNKTINILLVLYLTLVAFTQVIIIKDSIVTAWLVKKSLHTSALVALFNRDRVDNTFTCFTLRSLVYQQLTVYAHGKYVGNTPNLWWLIGKNRLAKKMDVQEKLQLAQKNNFLINSVAFNLVNQKPHFVLINKYQPLAAEKTNINILQELNQNENFRQAWLPYHLMMATEWFQVFERS